MHRDSSMGDMSLLKIDTHRGFYGSQYDQQQTIVSIGMANNNEGMRKNDSKATLALMDKDFKDILSEINEDDLLDF